VPNCKNAAYVIFNYEVKCRRLGTDARARRANV
jgi:hypothetical protein